MSRPSRIEHQDIRIGTLAPLDRGVEYLDHVMPHGFECFELTLWQYIGENNVEKIGKEVRDFLGDDATVSSIGLYGNPLQDEKTASDWARMIRAAKNYDCNVVCGFAGALEDRPVDESMAQFKKVFGPLAKLAEDHDVKIAFENCDMGGTWNSPRWNIAHSPRAWEMMFNEVPSDAIGLEWEPCHQMVSLIEPIPQLRQWAKKVHHVHGKDATIAWDVIESRGLRGGEEYVWHRTPGFGDTDWSDVITVLRQNNFVGAIDVEGWHDPVYSGELEMTGQVYAMEYLKACRGGDYIPNPPEKR
jgi:sugar phosphate isomerase/epimerase